MCSQWPRFLYRQWVSIILPYWLRTDIYIANSSSLIKPWCGLFWQQLNNICLILQFTLFRVTNIPKAWLIWSVPITSRFWFFLAYSCWTCRIFSMGFGNFNLRIARWIYKNQNLHIVDSECYRLQKTALCTCFPADSWESPKLCFHQSQSSSVQNFSDLFQYCFAWNCPVLSC